MKLDDGTKRLLAFFITIAILLCVVGFTQRRAVRWEYRVERNTLSRNVPLNELGEEGWELVTTASNDTEYIFKRQK